MTTSRLYHFHILTTSLQQNIGALSKSIADMNQSIGNISTQATKIGMLGKKYEETEALTRRMYNIHHDCLLRKRKVW